MSEISDKKKEAEAMAAKDKKAAKIPVINTGSSTIYGRVPVPMQGANSVTKAKSTVDKAPALSKALSRVGGNAPTPEMPSGASLTSDTSGEPQRRMEGLKSMRSNYGSNLALASQRIATAGNSSGGPSPSTTAPLGYPSTGRELELPAMSFTNPQVTALAPTASEQAEITAAVKRVNNADNADEAAKGSSQVVDKASQAAGVTAEIADLEEANSLLDNPSALEAKTSKDSSNWDVATKLAVALLPAITSLAGYALGGRDGALLGGAAGFAGVAKGTELYLTHRKEAISEKNGWQKASKVIEGPDGKRKEYLYYVNPTTKQNWTPTDDKGQPIEMKDSISAMDLLLKKMEQEDDKEQRKINAQIEQDKKDKNFKVAFEAFKQSLADEKDEKEADRKLLEFGAKIRSEFVRTSQTPERVDEFMRTSLGELYPKYQRIIYNGTSGGQGSAGPGGAIPPFKTQEPATKAPATKAPATKAPAQPKPQKSFASPKPGKQLPTEQQAIFNRMSKPDQILVTDTSKLLAKRRGAAADISGTYTVLENYRKAIDSRDTPTEEREKKSAAYITLAQAKLKQFQSLEGADAVQQEEAKRLASELNEFQGINSPYGVGFGKKLPQFHRKIFDIIQSSKESMKILEREINSIYDKYTPANSSSSLRTIRIKKDAPVKPGQVFPMAGARWKVSEDGKTATEVK